MTLRVTRVMGLVRLLRRWRPDRNPLRRGSDLTETFALALLLTAFLAGAPLLGQAAGQWAYTTSAHEAQVERSALHLVSATLLQTAPYWNGFSNSSGTPEVSARWRAPDGHLRTAKLLVPDGAPAGSTVQVWTDQAGQLADPPLQHAAIISRVQLTTAIAVAGLAILLSIIGWLVRHALDRRRMAGWDADWLANGPHWTPRR